MFTCICWMYDLCYMILGYTFLVFVVFVFFPVKGCFGKGSLSFLHGIICDKCL